MILLKVTVGQVQSRDQYWDPGLVPRPDPSLPTRNTFSHINILANCVCIMFCLTYHLCMSVMGVTVGLCSECDHWPACPQVPEAWVSLDPPTFWALLALHIYVKQFEPSSSHIRESITTMKCP